MRYKTFPMVESHADARCFNCNGALNGKVQHEHYAFGNGEFSQYCDECRRRTWYDLKDGGRDPVEEGEG